MLMFLKNADIDRTCPSYVDVFEQRRHMWIDHVVMFYLCSIIIATSSSLSHHHWVDQVISIRSSSITKPFTRPSSLGHCRQATITRASPVGHHHQAIIAWLWSMATTNSKSPNKSWRYCQNPFRSMQICTFGHEEFKNDVGKQPKALELANKLKQLP